jgi:WD40 repeat protein
VKFPVAIIAIVGLLMPCRGFCDAAASESSAPASSSLTPPETASIPTVGLNDLPSQTPNTPILSIEPAYTAGTTNSLSWTAVTSATAYYLEWSTNLSFTPQTGNSDWIAATFHTATGLSDGQTYYYHVKARDNLLAESAWSNITSSTQDASPPSAPGTPTDEGTTWPAHSVRFFWTAGTDTGSGVASYDLQVGSSPGGSDAFNASVGNVLTWAATGQNGQTLYARVRALDRAGNVGPWSGSSNGIRILTRAAPAVTTPLHQYGLGTLACAAYSPDGKTILTAGGGGAFLRNAETAEVVRRFHATGHFVNSLAFSPDGARVLTGGIRGEAKVWDAQTGLVIRTLPLYLTGDVAVAFSPDGGKILTGDWGGTARIWDADTGALLQSLPHDNYVSLVAFSGDGGRILTVAWDGKARVWDINTGSIVTSFSEVTRSAAISPNGRVVLTTYEKSAKLWDANTGSFIRAFSPEPVWDYTYIESVAFSPDGTKVLTGFGWDFTSWSGGQVIIWDVNSGVAIRTLSGHAGDVYSAIFSPDGSKVLTSGSDEAVRLWDGETGVAIRTFGGHTAGVNSAVFSPDCRMILTADGGLDQVAKVWDVNTAIRTLTFHDTWFYAVFSPDGQGVLTSHSWGATLWDFFTGLRILDFPAGGIGHLAIFSPQGTKILIAGDVELWLYNASTGAQLYRFLHGFPWSTSGAAFSPDGRKFLLTDESTAKMCDTETGQELRSFSDAGGGVAFSHNGARILAGLGLRDPQSGALLRMYNYQVQLYANCVAFSPNDNTVLTGGVDGSAATWNTETGQQLRTFRSQTGAIGSVAFSPSGSQILTGSRDGTCLIWELNPPRVIVVAGGGAYNGNAIAEQTEALGAYAYKVLKARGYEAENIQYLTAFGPTDPANPSKPFRDGDGDGLNDADDWATLDTLRSAIAGPFGEGAGRLLIIMVDHGYRTESFTAFMVNHQQAVLSTTLDTWLDDLQTSHSVDVTLVVDCCYSGQFVSDCRETSASLPAGRKRLVLASTSANAEAVFLPPPDMTSFIYQFLGSAYMGNSMGEAWRAGKRFFEEFPVAGQTPQIDDGTTGTANADREFFGATWAYGVQSTDDVNRFFPAFESWTTNTIVTPGTSVTLWTRMLPGQNPLEVVAVVRPPAPTVISGDPVTNLPHLSLRKNAGDPRLWEATTSSVFASLGAYVVSFTARFEYERLSNPVFTRITVSEGIDPDATPIRAILAVGEGGSPSLDSAFEGLGAYAYGVYLARFQDNAGVHHPEWIEYLTPYLDSQRDGVPTTAGIIAAINNVPLDVGRLYVHLIGNSAAAETIRFSSGETLTASALDAALDALQTRQTCAVVLAVDAPHSGSFLPVCRAMGGQQRVVMAGSRASDTAFFLSWPVLSSFSQKFLGSAYQGNHLKDGFSSARNFFSTFLLGMIQPQMDDNGDGVSNKYDGQLAKTLFLGRRYAFAGDKASGLPFVLDVTSTQTARPLTPVAYTARLVEGIEPTRVFAQLVPPGIDHSSGPVSSLPEIVFTRDAPTSWTWTAAFNAPTSGGLYTLVVYAAYPDSADERFSEPAYSALDVRMNSWPPDRYEVDDTATSASEYMFSEVGAFPAEQRHNFHDAGDVDWVRFFGFGSRPYSMHIEDVGTSCDAVVELYASTTATVPLAWTDFGGMGEGELLTQILPTTGTYYWKIYHYDAAVYGAGTSYTARLTNDTGANNGLAIALGASAMRCMWTSGLGPGDPGFDLYHRTLADISWTKANTSPITDATYDDMGLEPSTVYFYHVRVKKADGSEPLWTGVFSGTTSATVSVVTFDAAASAAPEGVGTANLLLTLSAASGQTVTVSYSVSGTATPGLDYVALPGSITFNPGETTKNISVQITDDTIDEPDETVILTLTGAINATPAGITVHTLTILDNDPSPTVGFATSLSSASENAGTANIVLSLSAQSEKTVTVNYSVGGTATPGQDYVSLPGSITFYAGEQTKNIAITIVNDAVSEPDETIILTLTNATNAVVGTPAVHTFVILDDDRVSVSFGAAFSSASEGAGTVNVVVTLSQAAQQTVTVAYSVGGSATPGLDYVVLPGSLTFNAGEQTKNIAITIVNDAVSEPDETIILTLTNATNAVVGTPAVHTFVILDDDRATATTHWFLYR